MRQNLPFIDYKNVYEKKMSVFDKEKKKTKK